MAKYGIGDKVRVRDDLKYGEWYYMYTSNESQMVNEDMIEKVGQIVTIKDFDESGCYYIEEDEWHWTDEMFSESNEATKKYPVSNLKVGDKVRVRENLKLDVDYCMCDGTLGVEINREMKNKGGAIVTIKEFDENGRYYIEEDQWHWTDEMFSEKIKEQSKEEEKEDKPSLLEYQIEHQHDIPKRLFYLAEKYPNITWKKAKEYYARVVDNVILGAGEENLFSGSLSFGRGLNEAAARFEELLKLEEKAVSLKSTGTIATFEGVPVFEDKTPKLVSHDEKSPKKIDCFSCTSADCANCENFKYKMAIT